MTGKEYLDEVFGTPRGNGYGLSSILDDFSKIRIEEELSNLIDENNKLKMELADLNRELNLSLKIQN